MPRQSKAIHRLIDWPVLVLMFGLAMLIVALYRQSAFSDPSPLYSIEVQSESENDLTCLRKGVPLWSIKPANRTPIERGNLLRVILPQVTPGDTLALGKGVWDTGLVHLQMPPGVTMIGWGKGQTTITNSHEDQRNFCAFELARGCAIKQMTLIWKPKDDQIRGGQTVGLANPNGPPMVAASLEDVEAISYGGAAGYWWGAGKGHKVRAVRTDFIAGRWGCVFGSGSADDSVTGEFIGCSFTSDFATYKGAGGDMVDSVACLLRGGGATFDGCRFTTKGFGGTGVKGDGNELPFKQALGLACSSLGDRSLPIYGNGKWPAATATNCTFDVTPNGATTFADVQEYIGAVTCIGCKGSGPGGSLIVSGTVDVK